MKTVRIRTILLALCVTVACFTTLVFNTSTANASASYPKIANDSSGPLVNSIQPNGAQYCLGIPGGSTQVGAQTIMWNCNGHSDQNWTFHFVGFDFNGSYFNIINVNSNLCLGIPGSSSQNGVVPVQWSCNGHQDQLWYDPSNSNGSFNLVNRNDNKCLGVSGGNVTRGATPVQWSCDNSNNQNWFP